MVGVINNDNIQWITELCSAQQTQGTVKKKELVVVSGLFRV